MEQAGYVIYSILSTADHGLPAAQILGKSTVVYDVLRYCSVGSWDQIGCGLSSDLSLDRTGLERV